MPHQCTGCGHAFADGSKEMLSGCPECGGNKFQFRPEEATVPDDPSEAEAPSDVAGTSQPAGAGMSPPADTESGSTDGEAPAADAGPPDPDGTSSSVAETVGRATTKVRDFVSSGPAEIDTPDPNASWPSEREEAARSNTSSDGESTADSSTSSGTDDIIDADARRAASEDDAQVSARTDVVSEEEMDVDDSEEELDVDVSGEELDVDDSGGAGGPNAGALAGNGSGPPSEAGGEVVSEPSDETPDIAELREQLNDQFESIKIVEPGQYELNLMELYDREEYIIALQENGRYVIQVPEQWIGDDPDER